MLVHWIWLATRQGIQDSQKASLVQHFQDAEDLYYADASAFDMLEELSLQDREALLDKDLKPAERIMKDCAKKQIRILTYRDAGYPSRLRNISDPPMVLYYKGMLPEFDAQPVISMVGTRKASGYGLTSAKRMGSQIAACGGLVVSGAAAGVDAMAMWGALGKGGMVVGVLGNGADVVYPASSRSLYADTERCGCLLTEFPPGTPPYKWNFPKRNRIISGLCNGVLVVEAPETSGALITARRAADKGRYVFVVPGNIDVETCKGSNALLREGAIAVSSGWDILSEYAAQYPAAVRKNNDPSRQTAYPDEMEKLAQQQEQPLPKVAQKTVLPGKKKKEKFDKNKKVIDNGLVEPYIDAETKRPPLTNTEQTVMEHLQQNGMLVDELIAVSGMPAGTISATLTMLQIKGLVKLLPGNRVERT